MAGARLDTPLIGRAEALEALARQCPQQRVVSIVGPGGIGKTRLAQALAETVAGRFRDGTVFVDLAPLASPRFVHGTLAAALQLPGEPEPHVGDLAAVLEARQMLIVLDNCEHVIEAVAALVEGVLARAPRICFVATSREALRVADEHVHRLRPMEVPGPSEGLGAAAALAFPSVRLFADCAAASLPGFALTDADAPAVGSLCRRLDGIPLAIELVAARVRRFGVQELADQLDRRLLWLKNDLQRAPRRHRSLHALLDWSHDLLPEAEKKVLRRLAVFRTRFTLAAAAAVAADQEPGDSEVLEPLLGLASKSLLVVADTAGAEPRYGLLDTTRAYASEKLAASGELPRIARRHAQHLHALFEQAQRDSPAMDRPRWLAVYGGAIDDVRAALAWAFSAEGDAAIGIALTAVTLPLGYQLSLLDEYQAHVEQALERLQALRGADAALELRLRTALGGLLGQTRGGGPDRMKRSYRQAMALAARTGALVDEAAALDGAWMGLFMEGEYPRALEIARRCSDLAHGARDAAAILRSERMLAQCFHFTGQHRRAGAIAQGLLDSAGGGGRGILESSVDPRVSMRVLLARMLWLQGRARQAAAMAAEALELAASDVSASLAQALAWAACPIAFWSGDEAAARGHLARLFAHTERYGLAYWQAWARGYDAALALCWPGQAARPADAGDARSLPPGADMLATLHPALLTPATVARAEAGTAGWCAPEILRLHGEALRAQGQGEAAEAALRRSLQLAREQGALAWELRGMIGLAQLLRDTGRAHEARDPLAALCTCFAEAETTADLLQARTLLQRRDE